MDMVLIETVGGVATVTLSRPSVLNAVNMEMRTSLTSAFEELTADDEVRVIILQGSGTSFCAGQDQKESAAMDEETAADRITTYVRLYEVMRKVPKPVIAKMRGYAVGAGLQIALLCDLRIASETTTVGMTELKMGSACILGSTLLMHAVGESAMKRLVLTGELIPAKESFELGMVHEVVSGNRIDERVEEIASKWAEMSASPVALTKAWWAAMSDEPFRRAVDEAHRSHARNYRSGSLSEAARAWTARRD